MWVLVNKTEKIVIFFYDNGSRGREVLTDFVGEAELKSLMSDGYNAYTFIGDELKGNNLKYTVHLVCMAHLRAKLIKALSKAKTSMHACFWLSSIDCTPLNAVMMLKELQLKNAPCVAIVLKRSLC